MDYASIQIVWQSANELGSGCIQTQDSHPWYSATLRISALGCNHAMSTVLGTLDISSQLLVNQAATKLKNVLS